MANKTSESRNSLLSFLEVSETINSSFGAKKGINTADKSSREYQKHQSMVLRGVELLIEFTKLNPSELVEFGRKAASNTQAMADAKKTMREFLGWLVTNKEYSEGSAKTIRGYALSLFKAHGIRIPTVNGDSVSEKKKRDQELGIDNADKLAIIRKMYKEANPEMKCFITLGLACGHRISDLIKIKKATIETGLTKDIDYLIYTNIDKKEGAIIKAVFGRAQQAELQDFLASDESKKLGEDRIYLFGDSTEKVDGRIRQNMVNLLKKVSDFDENVITPHTLRSMCETILTNHGYPKTQVYQFTGHKDGEKYIELTDEQIVKIFKSIESDINITMYVINMGNENEIIGKISEILSDLVKNKGKTDAIVHHFHEIGDDLSNAPEMDAKAVIETKLATFLDAYKESLYTEFKARIMKDLNL